MGVEYLHLSRSAQPPELSGKPIRAVIITEGVTEQGWRDRIARWLVDGGCRYAVTWGPECEAWHDAIDWAMIDKFENREVPDEDFIMTTWHDKESLREALWFAGHVALHPEVDLDDTLLVHIADEPGEDQMLRTYGASQTLPEDE
jgi:hypothetical protein